MVWFLLSFNWENGGKKTLTIQLKNSDNSKNTVNKLIYQQTFGRKICSLLLSIFKFNMTSKRDTFYEVFF